MSCKVQRRANTLMTLPHSLKTARRLLRRARSMWSSHSGRKPFFSSSSFSRRRLISPEPVHHLSPSFSQHRPPVSIPTFLLCPSVFMFLWSKLQSFLRHSFVNLCLSRVFMTQCIGKVGHTKKNDLLLGAERRNVDMKVEFWSDLSIGQWMTICNYFAASALLSKSLSVARIDYWLIVSTSINAIDDYAAICTFASLCKSD